MFGLSNNTLPYQVLVANGNVTVNGKLRKSDLAVIVTPPVPLLWLTCMEYLTVLYKAYLEIIPA